MNVDARLGYCVVNTSTGNLVYSRMSAVTGFARAIFPTADDSSTIQIIKNDGYWIKHDFATNTTIATRLISSIAGYYSTVVPDDNYCTVNFSSDMKKIFKLDVNGQIVWTKAMPDLGTDYLLNRISYYNGFLYINFYLPDETGTPRQRYFAQLDLDGNLVALLKSSFIGDIICKHGRLLVYSNYTLSLIFGDIRLASMFEDATIYRYSLEDDPAVWYVNRVNNIVPYLLRDSSGVTSTAASSINFSNSTYLAGANSSVSNLI